MKYTGRTAVVTGAGNGIGKCIATWFFREGANVVIADIDAAAGREFAEQLLKDEAGRAAFFEMDASKPESISRMMTGAKDAFGSIDILINNAGISEFHDFFSMTPEKWDTVLNTNLKGMFFCSQAAAKVMKENGGTIINIASTRAFMSEPDTEAYSASKGGIVALTHAMARTLGPYGITVNSISPGWIETKDYDSLSPRDHAQHVSKRVGKPEDVARACLFLADSENNFITGENLVIDGGMTRKMIYVE